MRKSDEVRVHHKRKSDGVTVYHKKERWGECSPCEKDGLGES